jgi:hypothetical protein
MREEKASPYIDACQVKSKRTYTVFKANHTYVVWTFGQRKKQKLRTYVRDRASSLAILVFDAHMHACVTWLQPALEIAYAHMHASDSTNGRTARSDKSHLVGPSVSLYVYSKYEKAGSCAMPWQC